MVDTAHPLDAKLAQQAAKLTMVYASTWLQGYAASTKQI